MATLELLIDASGATRGAQQAEAALGRVKTAAEATATTTMRVGQSLSSAFQATGGSIQIAQGISQTATALGSLNTAAAAFSASRVLLEISKTARDFQQFRSGIQGATSAWGALGLAFRANPIGLIATGVSVAAAALSIFGNNAKQAADGWDRLGESIKKAGAAEAASRFLGKAVTGSERLSAIETAVQGTFEPTADYVGTTQFANAAGVDRMQVMRFLAQTGMREAAEYMRTGGVTAYGPGRSEPFFQPGFLDLRLSPERQREFLALQYRGVQNRYTEAGRTSADVYQFGAPFTRGVPEMFGGPPTMQPTGDYVSQSADERMRVEQENAERIQESMSRAADYAGQIGDAFGSSLADVLFKTASLRQVFQSILQQSVRDGLGTVGRAAFQAVLGLTTNQQGANAGIRKPGES